MLLLKYVDSCLIKLSRLEMVAEAESLGSLTSDNTCREIQKCQ